MYIEVKKKSGGKYEVAPDVTPGSGESPLVQIIPGIQDYYGITFFVDENNYPVAIENFETFNYSVIYTIFIPGDYSNTIYHKGTDFDELVYEEEGSDRRIYIYKNSETVNDIWLGEYTSTTNYTVADLIGLS